MASSNGCTLSHRRGQERPIHRGHLRTRRKVELLVIRPQRDEEVEDSIDDRIEACVETGHI